MTVEKRKPKQLLQPITTGTSSDMNQSQFLAITCNSPEAREKSRVHGAIGFAFASNWLKNWRDSFKPITKPSNHVITFDSHLKTAQSGMHYFDLIVSSLARVGKRADQLQNTSFQSNIIDIWKILISAEKLVSFWKFCQKWGWISNTSCTRITHQL